MTQYQYSIRSLQELPDQELLHYVIRSYLSLCTIKEIIEIYNRYQFRLHSANAYSLLHRVIKKYKESSPKFIIYTSSFCIIQDPSTYQPEIYFFIDDELYFRGRLQPDNSYKQLILSNLGSFMRIQL